MYVTGFIVPNSTRTEIQLIPKCYTPAQSRCYKHMAIYRWPSLILQTAFCPPCQTMKVHYRVCAASKQHYNKDICGAKLLSTVVSAYVSGGLCLFLWLIEDTALLPVFYSPLTPAHPTTYSLYSLPTLSPLTHPPPYMPLMLRKRCSKSSTVR